MRYFVQILLLLLLCGCTETVTKTRLYREAHERDGGSFPETTYYIGSDSRYDYFNIRGANTRHYRVLASDNTVTNRFNKTKDESRWRWYTGVHTNGLIIIPSTVVTNKQ